MSAFGCATDDLKVECSELEAYNLKVIMTLSDFMSSNDLWEDFYNLFDKKYPGERQKIYDR